MKRHLLTALFVLVSLGKLQAQDGFVNVKLRVLLVDRDLNQKPVPFYIVRLSSAANGDSPSELKTDLDGKSERLLAPGKYSISTPKPVELGGKLYTWNLDVQISGAEQRIDLTNDNAKMQEIPASVRTAGESKPSSATVSGDLTALFDKLKNSVVSVHSEAGDGSGFMVDSAGLVVTNNHVVQSSSYLAVQFDEKRKVPARLITSDADKDVAVLWVDPAAFKDAVVAPLLGGEAAAQVVVGQRVFTIGNPLGRDKVLTTGVISKVDKEALTSDLSINPGNSGGPLFTLNGQVAGITTAGLRTLASIVPIEKVRPLVEMARKNIAGGTAPTPTLLPVEPTEFFPAETLREMLKLERIDTKPYFFGAGEFQVSFITPPMNYFLRHEEAMAAARKAAKRSGGDPSQVQPPKGALEDAQDYRPVLVVRVRPKFGAFLKVRFKNGFVRMRLLCGGKEITPIEPGRTEYQLLDQSGRTVDTTFQGRYVYPADAVSPACGIVVLEIFSEKDPKMAVSKPIDEITVGKVWADFDAFRKAQASQTPGAKP